MQTDPEGSRLLQSGVAGPEDTSSRRDFDGRSGQDGADQLSRNLPCHYEQLNDQFQTPQATGFYHQEQEVATLEYASSTAQQEFAARTTGRLGTLKGRKAQHQATPDETACMAITRRLFESVRTAML